MRRSAFCVVFALLVAATAVAIAPVGPGVAAGSDGGPVAGADRHSQPPETDVSPEHTVSGDLSEAESARETAGRPQLAEFEAAPATEFHIDLQPDRNAHWTVRVRYEFTDDNETAAFERVGDRFVAGEVAPSADLYRSLANTSAAAANREMEIVNVERDVVVDRSPAVDDEEVVAVGELRLSFVWTSFLATDGENLILGDAFATDDGGSWLRTLEGDQTVVIRTPDGYEVFSSPGVEVSLRERAVVIDGPRTFESDEHVEVVYAPTGGGLSTSEQPWLLLAGGLMLAALVGVGLLASRRLGGNGPAGVAERGAVDEDGPSSPEPARDVAGGAGAEPEPEPESEPEPEEDLSLLSDEERVERLLERNGGRMRQADIVTETGWSDAKVSQLLSAMAENERVAKLRLGRENLISLPDHEPNAGFGSDEEGRRPDDHS